MSSNPSSNRFPRWLWRVAWLGFGILGVLTVAMVAWWWLTREAHLRTRELVGTRARLPEMAQGREKSATDGMPAFAATSIPDAPERRGTPVTEIPFLAELLETDADGQFRVNALRQELNEFGTHIRSGLTGGPLSFRAVLLSMGREVPESMTETDAAAVFLKEADRFGALLAQWAEALKRAPWEFGKTRPERYLESLTGQLAKELRGLVGALAEAHWRRGDADAAWKSFELMHSSLGDATPYSRYRGHLSPESADATWYQTYRSGLTLGAFTNAQLGDLPSWIGIPDRVAVLRREMDDTLQKLAVTYDRRGRNPGRRGSTENPVADVFQQLGTHLVSPQQLADNESIIQHAIDQVRGAFDPSTGLLRPGYSVPPGPGDLGRDSDSWFNQWYFQYAVGDGFGQYRDAPEWALHSQTTLDHMRLAAALERHQRETGHYPESLGLVAGRLPGGEPRDLATGEPYRYRRLPEGGFLLWGRGIDQTDNGGTPGKDVVWEHPPAPKP